MTSYASVGMAVWIPGPWGPFKKFPAESPHQEAIADREELEVKPRRRGRKTEEK